jgi:tetratricopeptide (TPR) repeat protein
MINQSGALASDRDIARFTHDIACDPTNIVAYEKRGLEQQWRGEFDQAIADFTELIRLMPHDARGYKLRAEAYFDKAQERVATNKEDVLRAIDDCDEVLRLNSADAPTFAFRGELRARNNDYPGAIADYTSAIAIEPKPYFYDRRGWAHYHSRDFDSAIADFDQAILDPDRNRAECAYSDRGKVWQAKGDFERALADFHRGRELGIKGAAGLYRERGRAAQARGDYGPAIADFDQALQMRINNEEAAEILCDRGDCHLASGARDQAVTDFAEAVRRHSENKAARTALARLQVEQMGTGCADRRRLPWLAGVLGFLMPGLGHIYVGRAGRGVLLFVVFQLFSWVAFASKSTSLPVIGIAGLTLWLISVTDPVMTARQLTSFEPKKYNRWWFYPLCFVTGAGLSILNTTMQVHVVGQ